MVYNACRQNGVGWDGIASSGTVFSNITPVNGADSLSISKTSLDRLHPPIYAFAPVETRLFTSLCSGFLPPKITTVVAPPGYGKTVLFSQLYQIYMKRGIDCVWIGLEEGHSSLGDLLTLMENALGLAAKGQAPFDTIDRIERILSCVHRCSPRILFIDNINFCREPGVERLLDALVFHSPEPIKLLVSSAGPVPFDATRARLELNFHPVIASDLSFDQKAIAELFSRAGITNVDSGVLETILKKTEGWPAAVRLLQLIVTDENSLERGIDLLSGDETHIADILSRRLMSSFEPDLITFLHEIAELRHFSVDLAQSATGDARAASWIELLVNRNVMIIPVDRRRRWYRFHTLFRQFLMNEATHCLPAARRNEVRLNASRWLMKHRDYQGALELAIKAQQLELVTELLEKVACSLVRELGGTSTFISWVQHAEGLGAHKGVQATFWYVWALLWERQYEAARAEVAQASEHLHVLRPGPISLCLQRKLEVASIVIALHLDTPNSVQHLAVNWLRTYTDAEAFEIAAAAGSLACSRLGSHSYMMARRDLATSQAAIARAGSEYARCWIELLSELLEIRQGNPASAEPRLRAIEQRARTNIGPTAGIASVVALVRARALYDCGRREEASKLVVENLHRASENGVPDTTWLGIEVLLPSAVRGEGSFTVDHLRAMVREYPRRLNLLFEFGLVHELALVGRSEDAVKQATKLGWNPRTGWASELTVEISEMERSSARLAAIALFISSGHFAGATELIKEEMRLARITGRKIAQVDLYLLNADLQLRSNARPAALRAVGRAVAMASGHSLYAPFLQRKTIVRHVFANIRTRELGLTSSAELSALSEILALIEIEPSTSVQGQCCDAVPDPPTPRELELLLLLESGLDNLQISAQLSLSMSTVKWHLSNLYCKLGVKNRAAAIAKGRTLHLLAR